MTEFLITELDDRLEFGVATIEDEFLDDNEKCQNGGNCCGTNTGCSNANCGSTCCTAS